MATDFDSMFGGGASMSSGFAGLAAMFSGMQQQRALDQERAMAREQDTRNFLQQQTLLDRDLILRETQLRNQARQQAEQMQFSREESAFDRLNRTLTLQMEMADKEAVRRERAFALSQQAISNDIQAKKQMLELRALEGTVAAAGAKAKVDLLTKELAVATRTSNDAEIARINTALDNEIKAPYYAYFDGETQKNLLNQSFAASLQVAQLSSLDSQNLAKNYTIPETALEISKALKSNSASPRDLQSLSYLKKLMTDAGILSSQDKVISPSDVDLIRERISDYFSPANARTIQGWLENPSNRTKLADELTKLPDRPLGTEERSKYFADTRQLDELENRVRAGIFDGSPEEKNLLLQYINSERAAAFFSASGSVMPDRALQSYETYDEGKIMDGYIDYAFDDINTPDDQAPFSARKYYVRTASTRLSGARTGPAAVPIPVEFKSREWKAALLNGTLMYDRAESVVSPDTGETETGPFNITRYQEVVLPVATRRAASTIAKAQEQVGAVLGRGTASMFMTTPDSILQNVFNAHESALKAIDLELRSGRAGNDALLDVGRFLPRSSIVKIDLIARMLQRGGVPMIDPDIRQINPDYRNQFIYMAENLSPLNVYQYYLPRVSTSQQLGMMGGNNATGQMSSGGAQSRASASLPWQSGTGSEE